MRCLGPCARAALAVMALATRTWVVSSTVPPLALGGSGVPAPWSLAGRQVGASEQGRLPGVLASAVSLASVAPLAFSSHDVLTEGGWPGAVWLSAIAVHATGGALVPGLRFGGAPASAA